MSRNLREMTVVITGASAGIGRALAEELSAGGARLVLSARRLDRLDELNRQLGGRHVCVRADVAREEDCRQLIEQAHRAVGRIDVLVCNAGYGILRPVIETSGKEMTEIFQTNVFGTMDCIRYALPIMVQQEIRDGYRAQIMIVSSAAARRGLPFFGPYSATKAAQLSMAEALRVELHEAKIAVTSVHPIGTATEFFEVAEQQGGKGRKLPPRNPVDVVQTPATVARKMARAMEKPKREVWPMRPARWALSLATLVPGLVDRVMIRARGKIDATR